MTVDTEVFLGMEGVKAILPHREPMLFVDRVVSFDHDGEKLVAELDVTDSHCAGHFPGNSVFPGIYALEALAQACGLFFALREGISLVDKEFFFVGATIKWRKVVKPRDRLSLRVELVRERAGNTMMSLEFNVEAFVGDTLVATARKLSFVGLNS